VLWAWWLVLHAVVVAAAVLVGWPIAVKALAAIAVVGHGYRRRPRASPRLVLVGADGLCAAPEWNTGPRPLGARTFVCPFWALLDLGAGGERRDILLLADQLSPEAWRRLCALLARARCESATAVTPHRAVRPELS
jgi:hypothetical protein